MKTWLIGCAHFGHWGIYKFTRDNGERLRPYADNPEDGDAYLMQRWQETIAPDDKVYVMGDVCISKKSLQLLEGLNGRLTLIKGNHDRFKLRDYLPYFDDILAEKEVAGCILSHRPIHPGSLPKHCFGNIHAHTHDRFVMMETAHGSVRDPRYFNTCVEVCDFRPVLLQTATNELARLNPKPPEKD